MTERTEPPASSSDDRYALFVRAHTDALLKTAYLLTRNSADAEEVVQDTLVWLYPRWAQVEAADHPLAYVRKAVVNRFLAGRRKMAATEIRFGDDLETVISRADDTDPQADFDGRDAVWQELGVLPERQRAALVLRFFHDLADADVADALDCRVGTVRSLISRGLAALRTSGRFADDSVGSFYLRNIT